MSESAAPEADRRVVFNVADDAYAEIERHKPALARDMARPTSESQGASPFTSAQLTERTVHRRGVEAAIWGMPAVNFDLLYQALLQAKGAWNTIVYTLESIGIEKGKPFKPDAGTEAILEDAALEARAWLDARYEEVFSPPYFDGTHWAVPARPEVIEGMQTTFAKPDSYPVDGRGLTYSFVYFSAKHLGAGQFYLMTIKDEDGHCFDGAATYRLHVPANPPVKLYWSATAYDRATHALIRNMSWSSRSSHTPRLQKNPDGSVDIYFGPKALAGKESNWVPTDASGGFEVLFRLYGPEQPLFDKTWKLPDIEKVAPQ